ncbi:hypothetical protein [Streptomyces cinereospinus]|uniref:Helix-turn-helix domain-containing protein n=1 Tax=Streptomyces cinereospinus TaxID=285561 RepID=A0ABV5MV41_9ACTN
MSRKLARRPLAWTAAGLAVAAVVMGAPRFLPDAGPDARPAVSGAASVPAGSAECGAGGDGGRGGDGGSDGRPGEPGEPGRPGTRACTRFSDLPDRPKAELTVADKVRVVLVLQNGGATEAQVAGKYDMPKSEVASWRKAYLEGDWSVLTGK